MALTTTKLVHANSNSTGVAPTAGQMVQGQIAINNTDANIFIKDAANNIVIAASAAGHAAALAAVQTVNGESPVAGALTLTAANIGANGVVPLGADQKIAAEYLPASVVGALTYQGTYNATTQVPALPAATTNKGAYWVVSTAGTSQGLTLTVNDWIISNGTAYEKIDGQNDVSSVAGRTGAVVLTVADVSGAAPLAAPAFTGSASFAGAVTVQAPTVDTNPATKLYVDTAIAAAPGSGTVTSVNVTSGTTVITATGGPVTESGAIALDLATQALGLVLAGPVSGADAKPTFRALVPTDIPTLDEGTYA